MSLSAATPRASEVADYAPETTARNQGLQEIEANSCPAGIRRQQGLCASGIGTEFSVENDPDEVSYVARLLPMSHSDVQGDPPSM